MADVTYQTAITLARQLLSDARALIAQATEFRFQAETSAYTVAESATSASTSLTTIQAIQAQIKTYISQISLPHQWLGTQLRLLRPDGSWGPYVDLRGEQGLVGPKGLRGDVGPVGPEGKPGASVRVLGSLANPSLLPGTGAPGDIYLMSTTGVINGNPYTSGDGYIWVPGVGWMNEGPIRGPVGPTGPAGAAPSTAQIISSLNGVILDAGYYDH